jgi:hypothetical protein
LNRAEKKRTVNKKQLEAEENETKQEDAIQDNPLLSEETKY